MRKRENKKIILPSTESIANELYRVNYRSKLKDSLKSLAKAVAIVMSISIIVVTFVFQVLEVSGTSMGDTLSTGDYTLVIKKEEYKRGDIIAFYYNNKILIKRVIASYGEEISIDDDGNVSVDGVVLDEDYVIKKSIGECDLIFPYKVEADSYFVLGDSREDSLDSRISKIGSISKEDIIGKVVIRIYPLNKIKLY